MLGLKDKVEITGEIPIRSFLIYCYVCKIENGVGKFLLLKRVSQYLDGIWQPTTGRIEAGETAWQAALREVKEETQLLPDRFYSSNRVEQFYEPSHNCICMAPVFVAFIDSDQKVQLSSEHCEFQWSTADQAQEHLLFAQQRKTIKVIDDEFVKKDPIEFLRIKT